MRLPVLALVALALVPLSATRAAAEQDAATFFDENCAGCHTIGAGAQAGPDLRGVTTHRDRDWLIRFMLDPDAFASDPEVKRMVAEAGGTSMPATPGLTRALASGILDVIEQRSGTKSPATAAPVEQPFTETDITRGRDLFTGSSTLSAAGPACVACHESGDVATPSGRLGPDLTHAIDRLGGRRGLSAWLAAPPTPMMRAVYRPAPLTREEVRGLTAFLEHAATAGGGPRPAQLSMFSMTAVAAAAAMLVLVGALWTKRLRAVRRPFVDSMRGSIPAATRNAPGAGAARVVVRTTTTGGA